jgi:hypothetical protein
MVHALHHGTFALLLVAKYRILGVLDGSLTKFCQIKIDFKLSNKMILKFINLFLQLGGSE